MIESIDKAIEVIATKINEPESKLDITPDDSLKLTQAIVNLTHARMRIKEYNFVG